MAGGREHNTGHTYHVRSSEEKLRQGIHDESVVALVDEFLYKALLCNASDIHFQPQADVLMVRYRVDGVLYDQQSLALAISNQLISRIKVLSLLDIAERRLPQDGKFNVSWLSPVLLETMMIDFRVSTFPTTYGEKLVIRILNRSTQELKLESLGMSRVIHDQLKKITTLPHGFFLVTGPTGSGKTTTLYAMLMQINHEQKNIVTMEDPVEYDLPGIMQSQVNDKIGFSFDNGLRSLLRQDPDVIMIGEIRDKKTVQIAIESSLTGHLVFSTLHTNDAVSVISRLLDMGVESFLINATLTGILAQRLVRKLCISCKFQDALTPDERIMLDSYGYQKDFIHRAGGCEKCFFLGYKGRTGIFELVLMTDELRALVVQRPSVEQLHQYLAKNKISTLFHDSLQKLADGIISLEEFLMAGIVFIS